MTKLQIISKLWSGIYDLIFLIKGTPTKSLEEIETDLDVIEYACRRYADCDDDEIAIRNRKGPKYGDNNCTCSRNNCRDCNCMPGTD